MFKFCKMFMLQMLEVLCVVVCKFIKLCEDVLLVFLLMVYVDCSVVEGVKILVNNVFVCKCDDVKICEEGQFFVC